MLKTFEFCVKVLEFFGFWPIEDRANFLFRSVLWFLIIQQYYVGIAGHIYYIVSVDQVSFVNLSVDTLCLIPSALLIWIQLVLILNNKLFTRLVVAMSAFEDPALQPSDYLTADQSLHRLSQRIVKVILVFLAIAIVSSLFLDCEDNIVNDCGLITYSYPFFNVFYTPARQIFYFFQVCSVVAGLFVVISGYTIFYAMSQCIMSQLRHLTLMLKDLKSFRSRRVRRLHLKKCIAYHIQIIQLSEDFNAAYADALMIFLSAPIIISMIIYQILVERNHTLFKIIHISLWILIVTSASLNGETYMQHSLAISEVAYDCIEFDGDLSSQKDLLLMIQRSDRPLLINIGKFAVLKNYFALSTMKLAYTVTTYFIKRLFDI